MVDACPESVPCRAVLHYLFWGWNAGEAERGTDEIEGWREVEQYGNLEACG